MSGKKQTHQFQTEVQQLLHLIIHSLYSNKEIFLRELVSNASDAIDKLRFESQTNPALLGDDTEFKIKLTADTKEKTLQIEDNGIGMTEQELVENIGTIAKSGTKSFVQAIAQNKSKESLLPELIGQFGVGFYSAFMVANEITLTTKKAGTDQAFQWQSTGDGSFTIEPVSKEGRGTTITLKLKDKEEVDNDYTTEWTLRHIIKQHSDFINYPILMDVEKEVPELDADGKPIDGKYNKVKSTETLNSMKAIWTKDKKDVTDDEYQEFYKQFSHDWNKAASWIHLKLEGKTEYSALLYLPEKAPFDMFNHERKHGVSLYSKRVFIMDSCKELMPEYLRFIKGVVDASDLNLNVSREILQKDALITNIRKNLTKKVLDTLTKMEPDNYSKFYEEFGQVVKEGVHTDYENKDKITDLLRYPTTKSEGKLISLKDYVTNMPSDQKYIYYLTGDNMQNLLNNPRLEALKDKQYEVILMTDPVDEWVVQSLTKYSDKDLKSAEKGDLDLKEIDSTQKDTYSPLFDYMKETLSEKVEEVKPSSRLKDSASCLSSSQHEMSAYMEKILKATGRDNQKQKRILEINLDHPLVANMKQLFDKDKTNAILADYSQLLFDMAVISEGGNIDNPSRFASLVASLMNKSLGV